VHEHHAVEHLVKQVIKTAADNKAKSVTKVSITVGNLTGFKEDWIKSYYNQFAKGTIAEGAELDIHFEGPGKEFLLKDVEIEN